MSASPTEILERAADIRSRTAGEQHTYSAEESLVLFQADCIANSRRDSGISSIIKALIPSFKTEREQAQEALEKARQREAQAEQIASNIAALRAQLEKAVATRQRLASMADAIGKKTCPMREKFWARSEFNFEQHLRAAARIKMEDQMIAESLPEIIDLQNVEIAEASQPDRYFGTIAFQAVKTRKIATQGLPGDSLEIAIQGLLQRVAELEARHSYSTELPRRKSQRRSDVSFMVDGTRMDISTAKPTIRTLLGKAAMDELRMLTVELLEMHEQCEREKRVREALDAVKDDPVARLRIELAALRSEIADLRRHA